MSNLTTLRRGDVVSFFDHRRPQAIETGTVARVTRTQAVVTAGDGRKLRFWTNRNLLGGHEVGGPHRLSLRGDEIVLDTEQPTR